MSELNSFIKIHVIRGRTDIFITLNLAVEELVIFSLRASLPHDLQQSANILFILPCHSHGVPHPVFDFLLFGAFKMSKQNSWRSFYLSK